LPMRKHRKCYIDISAWADIGAKFWLHDIRPLVSPMTSLQLFVFSFEDWIQHVHVCKMATGKSRFHWSCYLNISINLVSVWEIHFFLFNSMLKYVIHRSMHAFFNIKTVIIPQPISMTHIHNFGVCVGS